MGVGGRKDGVGQPRLRARAQHLQAGHARHADVHEEQIRRERADLTHRVLAVGALADHEHVRLRAQELADLLAGRRLVIDDQRTDHVSIRCASARAPTPAEPTPATGVESTGSLTRVYQIAAPLPPYSSVYASPYSALSRAARADRPPR